MVTKEELGKLVDDHWAYVEKLCQHHYKTAFIHGFKHGIEMLKKEIKSEKK